MRFLLLKGSAAGQNGAAGLEHLPFQHPVETAFLRGFYASELKYRNVNFLVARSQPLCVTRLSMMNNTRKFVIYRRCSTARQFQSHLGLDAQAESVRRYLSTQPEAVVLADMVEAESGKNDDRPILRQAVDLCRKESATLLVSKIDRLSRSLRLIMMLEQYKVRFVAADNPEMNELVCHILVALAQSERKTIATRVREALRQAKIRGIKLGGPNIAEARLLANTARIQKAKEQNDKLRKVVQETMQKTGLTKLADIAQALNLRGIKTNRGSQFTPTQIHRLLKAAYNPNHS